MSRLDDWGLREFWYRIGDIFARKTEAGGSLSWDGGSTLGLTSVAGGSLGSVNLNNGLASDAEAAHSLSNSAATLTLSSVSNATLSTVNLTSAIESIADNRISSATDGMATSAWVKETFASAVSASITDKTITISLQNFNGRTIDTATVTVS